MNINFDVAVDLLKLKTETIDNKTSSVLKLKSLTDDSPAECRSLPEVVLVLQIPNQRFQIPHFHLQNKK